MLGCFWIWLHQLTCNVSNQAKARKEDAHNKPWRPLPSGRITEHQITLVRWMSASVCIVYSSILGDDIVFLTCGLFLTIILYEEGGFAGHYVGKNLCNVGGYIAFEIGATKIIGEYDNFLSWAIQTNPGGLLGSSRNLDSTSYASVIISGLLVLTTVQAQDFADVEGDKQLGRVTFPIRAPQFSRLWTLLAMVAWSAVLTWF